MDELLLKIHQLLPDMNATERKIADYVLEQPYELIQLPLRELANAIGVSQAAWVRFFKLLGFSGLKEVKQAISSSLLPEKAEEEEGAVYGDIIGFDSQDQLFRSLVEQEIRSLRETAQILDYSQLEKAAHAIRTASRVAFFGVGASGLVALDALHKFARIGIHVAACMDLHLQLTVASTLQKGDVAVLISHSGRTKDTLDILETAKKKGATLIGITKYGKSSLAKSVDILLYTSTPEISVRSGAMGSRTAQLLIIDLLFVCVANSDFQQAEQYLTESFETVSGRKKAL